jgi:thiol-disulfide isomerase/thioredoxin
VHFYVSLPLLSLTLLTPPLAGQDEPEAPPPPDAAVIMRAADEALTQLGALSFTVKTRGIGALATRSPQVEAEAHIRRASQRDPVGWTFRVEGTAQRGEQSLRLLTVYDGREVRSLREHEQAVIGGTWDDSADPMSDGAGWALTWIVRWSELVSRPFGDGGRPFLTRHEGVVEIDGTLCDVIYIDYSETADPNLFDAWWYIAREDALPRRVELHLVDHRFGDGFHITTITGLQPDAEMPSETFTLRTPDGFEFRSPEAPERATRAARRAGIPFGEVAPEWTLKDPAGREHTLSDYRGKVVVMDFWATWCGPCLRAMPGLQTLHEKYKDQGVVIFGINCWESGDPEALMQREGYTYTLLLDGDPVAAQYMVSGIPTFYVVSPDGRIAHHAIGFDPRMEQKLEEVIDALLP